MLAGPAGKMIEGIGSAFGIALEAARHAAWYVGYRVDGRAHEQDEPQLSAEESLAED